MELGPDTTDKGHKIQSDYGTSQDVYSTRELKRRPIAIGLQYVTQTHIGLRN